MSRSCLATLRFVVVVLILGLWLSTGWSADDQATFEAFYTRQWDANWILIGVGALAGAGIVFWTGGAAGPVVGGVGTLIGDLMGLHGIAATNAGLAWLGGGSVASGGLGMAGGAAVLSGALTLGGDVATDYVFFTVGKAF